MAHAISYKAPTGKTFKAVIKDLEAGLYWNNATSVWQTGNTAACQVTLTEGSTYKGVYTGSAGSTPVLGGMYQILVYDSNDSTFLTTTEEVYSPKTETVLEVINQVQLELGMPSSVTLADTLAKTILAKMNTILTVLLPQNHVFDHLKAKGTFTLKAGISLYRISLANVEIIDRVDYLGYNSEATTATAANSSIYASTYASSFAAAIAAGNTVATAAAIATAAANVAAGAVSTSAAGVITPLSKLNDGAFRELADNYIKASTFSAPEAFRIAQRDYNLPFVEIAPIPDKVYTITCEVVKGIEKLTLATEYVPIPLVVKSGALMLMKQTQGRDASADAAIFGAAMERAGSIEANASFSDVEV